MNADTATAPAVAVTEPWFLDPAIAGRTVIYAAPDGGTTVVVDLAEENHPSDISFLTYTWGPDGSPKGGYYYEGTEARCDYEAALAAEDGIVDDVLRPCKTNATAASGYWEWLRGDRYGEGRTVAGADYGVMRDKDLIARAVSFLRFAD